MYAIVVDKASDIISNWAEKHDVFLVQQISDETLPAAGEFIHTFEECAARGFTQIVCVTMSAALTHVYSSAVAAAQKVKHDIVVSVVDSKSFSAGEIFVVRELVACSEAGVDFNIAVERARRVADEVQLYVVSAPNARLLEGEHRRIFKKIAAAAHAWNGDYTVTRIENGVMHEMGHSRDIRGLAGRIVRNMSKYAQAHGSVRYIEAASGKDTSLAAFDKSLNTNEFPSKREMVIDTQDVVSKQAGFGAISIAFVPESVLDY